MRDFAFAKTRAAGYVVLIEESGRMTIHVIATCDTAVIYHGPYRPRVVTRTDDQIFIAADHVRLIDNVHCTEAKPCVDDLTIPDWWPFTNRTRPRCR